MNSHSCHCHGVFLSIYDHGVYIIGEHGIGKSELALELLTRKHKLIADDAPKFFKTKDTIVGVCPELLKDFLCVHNVGIINVKDHFGRKCVKSTQGLDLVVELCNSVESGSSALFSTRNEYNLLGKNITMVKISKQPGRNIALLVETIVKNFILDKKGISPLKDFLLKHNNFLRRNSNEACNN